MHSPLLLLLVGACLLTRLASPLTCKVGMGQRGKLYQTGVGWTRKCPKLSAYCFEAVTKDIKKARKLFQFPWDSYYDYFYIRSCGGDFGTNNTWHPYRNLPKLTRHDLGMVKMNVSTPLLISGEGCPYPPSYKSGDAVPRCKNTVEMDLRYKCKKDLCEKYSAGSAGGRGASLAAVVVAVIASFLTAGCLL